MYKEIHADGTFLTYEYDEVGNVVKVTNELGAQTSYTIAVYGVGVISERTTRIESDGLFFNEETQTNIYHYDHLGSTIHVKDESGNETYHAQYGTYGELRRLTDADGNETTLTESDLTYLYNGQYGVESEGNGLYYMRTRYYNTSIKRFMNRDVVNGDPTNAQSLNRFSYVQGNPISYTDPFGLSPEGVDYWLKYGHGILDLAGFIPGIGNVADFINALWYFQQGDTVTAIISLVAMLPILGIISNLIFKGAGKAAGKFMKYLNETGITDVITNWLKHASNSLSDVFKGGKIDLSAKNMEKVNQFLGKTKGQVEKAIDWLLHDNAGCFDPSALKKSGKNSNIDGAINNG